jgi:2'-hydroxyisoflavone reductase
MRVLILGGTSFVGRHLTEAALAAGHRVTLFNRGRTNPGLFPEAEHLQGDRGRDLSALQGRRWNVAIDVNGYLPKQVRASARLLADAVESYAFISTISVYADFKTPGLREDAPLEAPLPGDETVDQVPAHGYGRLKALCERAVEEAVPGRSLVVRPCIVVGPWDPTGRFAYWVERSFRGGEALAPGRPDRPVEMIDARDLAAWVVKMADDREAGIYNATGPESTLTMAEMLEACRDETGGSTRFTWVPDGFLEQRGIRLPFWLPEEKFGYDLADNSRAVSKGLTFRPLARTIRDVHDGLSENPVARDSVDFPPEREAELLREWRESGSAP